MDASAEVSYIERRVMYPWTDRHDGGVSVRYLLCLHGRVSEPSSEAMGKRMDVLSVFELNC